MVDVADSDVEHAYVAIYWIETDDLGAVLNDIRSRSGTPDMVVSSMLVEAAARAYGEFQR